MLRVKLVSESSLSKYTYTAKIFIFNLTNIKHAMLVQDLDDYGSSLIPYVLLLTGNFHDIY